MSLLYSATDGGEPSLLMAYHEALLMAAALSKMLPAALADSLPEQNSQFHIDLDAKGDVLSVYMCLKETGVST